MALGVHAVVVGRRDWDWGGGGGGPAPSFQPYFSSENKPVLVVLLWNGMEIGI